MESNYEPPLALTVISTIFIGSALLVSIWITYDIVSRHGWNTMMAIMIPVYILNALYLAPITLWTYLKYGRPTKPVTDSRKGEINHGISHEHHHGPDAEKDAAGAAGGHAGHEVMAAGGHAGRPPDGQRSNSGHEGCDIGGHQHHHEDHDMATQEQRTMSKHEGHGDHDMAHGAPHHEHEAHQMVNHEHHDTTHESHDMSGHQPRDMMEHEGGGHEGHGGGHHMHMMMQDRPMFATVTVGVCHCGAGCLLGDILGEWLVYGTSSPTINGRTIWVEWLVDYAFALLFGIVFQYFSIAPMSGSYGPNTLLRAIKADILSLTFFEVGLFGWMAVYQIAIWRWELGVNNVVYWWMMQVGMFLGHWTAFPINWWLISKGIKEPCA